jgi:branched-chain amino acid transport system substrate-binding protein
MRLYKPVALAIICVGLLAFSGIACAEPGVTADSVILGQSTAMSGPLAELGNDLITGARAYFDRLNAQGGVAGRKIKIITKDDAYEIPKTVANVKALVENDKVFMLFNTFGTPNNEAVLPFVTEHGVPLLAPYSGASSIRKPEFTTAYHVRASYADEGEKIIEHLALLGFTKIAVVYQNNAFGKEALAGVQAAMTKRNMKPVSLATVENSATDAAAAAKTIAVTEPAAVIACTAGKPTAEFIKNYNLLRKGTSYYTLSVMGTQTSVKALGPDGAGVVVSQVVPYPWSLDAPIIKEYQQAMALIGAKDYSFVSFEGFIDAKVFTEALRRAGKDLTRKKFLAAMASLKDYDLGGFNVSYADGSHSGSHLVQLTIIAADGRFRR